MRTLLILGGSGLARRWTDKLVRVTEEHSLVVRVVYSLAGITQTPRLPLTPPCALGPSPRIEFRSGGFGGSDGLQRWLVEHDTIAIIDGTHPFATKISINARRAADALSLPLFCLVHPTFTRAFDERRNEVRSNDDLQRVLARLPSRQRRRVVLALGAKRVRAIAKSVPARKIFIRSFASVGVISSLRLQKLRLRRARALDFCSMPKFSAQSVRNEARWMRSQRVSLLVCRDSGAREAYAKVLAARLLSVPTLIYARSRRLRAQYPMRIGDNFAPIIELLRSARA